MLARSAARQSGRFRFDDEPFPKIAVSFVSRRREQGRKDRAPRDGQQFIAYGIHPDTDKPYSWYGGEPLEIKREDLPYIHAEEAHELVDDAVKLLVDSSATASDRRRSQTVRAIAGPRRRRRLELHPRRPDGPR